jgi:hypothetical protein
MFIFNELVGEENSKLIDPICDETYNYLLKLARNNMEIYTKVFPKIPSDNIKKYSDIVPKIEQFESVEKYHDELKNIKGLIIPYPIKILENETLFPSWLDLQTRMLSYNLFT